MMDPRPMNCNFSFWIKAFCCLKYLTEGLVLFIETAFKSEYDEILKKFPPGLSCDQCNITDLKPAHERNTNGYTKCPLGQERCNCLKVKQHTKCKKDICGVIYDEILDRHVHCSPNWTNTNTHNWCLDYFEILKCFIKAPGYDDKKSVNELDIPALLQLIANNKRLQGLLACNAEVTRISDKRNKFCHSVSLEVEEEDFNELIDDCIAVLENKEVKDRPESKNAVEKMKQLKNSEVLKLSEEMIDIYKSVLTDMRRQLEQFHAEKHNEDMKTLQSKFNFLEKRLNDESQNEDRSTTYEERKEEFRYDLITLYREVNRTLPICPTTVDASVEHVCVHPQTNEEKRDLFRNHTHKRKATSNDVFQNGKRIRLTADSECGTTVEVQQKMLVWCQVHRPSGENCKVYSVEEIQEMREFDFVFYLDLGQINPEESDITCMIQNEIIGQLSRSSRFKEERFLEDILHKEKCLIILDGLDKRPNTSKLQGRAWEHCKVVTTTASWKHVESISHKISDLEQIAPQYKPIHWGNRETTFVIPIRPGG